MELMIAEATDILLSQPEEMLDDKDNLIVICTTKGIEAFSKITLLVSEYRYKDFSEEKLEELGEFLTKILFYSGCLTHLCDVDPNAFQLENLTSFSEAFHQDYQEDTILCSMNGMKKFIEITEHIFGNPDEEEEEEPESEKEEELFRDLGAEIAEKIVLEQTIDDDNDDEVDSEFGDSGFVEGEIEQNLAEIFGSVLILADHFNLDIEAIINNVGTLEKL